MKIELTIKTSYLPEWGSYEGIRELIQNGKDAQTEFDASFEVRYRKDATTLVIENEGATLPHEALLFGHTTKSGSSDLIGKFGEGLKLGVLALVRAGHPVKIRSGAEVWVPTIERSEKFDADVLVFSIEKGREPKNRVQVEIGGVTEAEWGRFADHFLFLGKLGKNQAIKTSQGTLLLDSKFKNRVYVKGIFVQKSSSDFVFGYDLSNASIDRDRKMIDSFDVNYATQAIWTEALKTRPDLINKFLDLLDSEAPDVVGIDTWNVSRLPEAVKVKAAELFASRHGQNAVPVSNLADSQDVEHLGKKGIVCPKPLRSVLETKLGTVDENKAKLARETIKLYGWHELSNEEKANLERSLFLLNGVAPLTIADVDVADFRDPRLQGLWKDGRIQIAKRCLSERKATLEILVHETAHKIGGGDGSKDHVGNIETLWSGIVERLTNKAGN